MIAPRVNTSVTVEAVKRGALALEETGRITAAAEAMGLARTSTPTARHLLRLVLGIEAPKRRYLHGGCGKCRRCRWPKSYARAQEAARARKSGASS